VCQGAIVINYWNFRPWFNIIVKIERTIIEDFHLHANLFFLRILLRWSGSNMEIIRMVRLGSCWVKIAHMAGDRHSIHNVKAHVNWRCQRAVIKALTADFEDIFWEKLVSGDDHYQKEKIENLKKYKIHHKNSLHFESSQKKSFILTYNL